MQAENLSYIIQAKSLHSEKWVKVFESTDYEKVANFYNKIKDNIYAFKNLNTNNNSSGFYLFYEKTQDILFSYSPSLDFISPSRWINIESIDIKDLPSKINSSMIKTETRLIEIVSQIRVLNETKE